MSRFNILLMILITMLASCKDKESDPDEVQATCLLITEDYNPETFEGVDYDFEYDGNNRITHITEYQFNGNSHFWFFYSGDEIIPDSIYREIAFPAETMYYLITYLSQEKIYLMNEYSLTKNGGTLVETDSLFLNENGQIVKRKSYRFESGVELTHDIDYFYNADNKNFSKMISYIAKRTFYYEYDDKHNPYYRNYFDIHLIGYPHNFIPTSNNITEVTMEFHDSGQTMTAEFTYDYNKYNYPTSMYDTEGEVMTVWEYEVMEY